MTARAAAAFVFAAALAAAACAGGGSGSSSSSGPANPTPPPQGGSTATITITTSGVSPKTVTISAGDRVTFVNNDTKSHNMQSDPHPEHNDCPELASVGYLTPGQSATSQNLNIVRTCGYHDHDNAGDTRVQGSIIIR